MPGVRQRLSSFLSHGDEQTELLVANATKKSNSTAGIKNYIGDVLGVTSRIVLHKYVLIQLFHRTYVKCQQKVSKYGNV